MINLKTSCNPEAKKVIEETIEKTNDYKAGRDVTGLTMQLISTLNNEINLTLLLMLGMIQTRMRE